MLRSVTLSLIVSLAVVTMIADSASAAAITPTYTSFGTLTGATFGGSGIPNDAVAITTFMDGGNTITLGLTATPRFAEPPVGNDGAGTFSAPAGGFPGDPSLARWNFGYYIDVAGGGVLDDYGFDLLYDFDPGVGTDDTVLGKIDFPTGLSGSTLQDSQNLGFGYLASGISGVVTPPTGVTSFDPSALGEYSFALRAFDGSGSLLGESAILVNSVPEPTSAVLLGLSALGMTIGGYRRRRQGQTA